MTIETFIEAKAGKSFTQEEAINLAYDNNTSVVHVHIRLTHAGLKFEKKYAETTHYFITRRTAIADANKMTRICEQQHRVERFGTKGSARYLIHNIVEDLWMDAVGRVVPDPRRSWEDALASGKFSEALKKS